MKEKIALGLNVDAMTWRGLPIQNRGKFYAVECVQGEDDWWLARAGIPTASEASNILTPKTLKPSAAQDAYINRLIAERVCLSPAYLTERGRPITQAMSQGLDTEPEARRFYEFERGETVERIGFCLSLCGRYGCSPDGLVRDGGLELKCPELHTHLGYLRRPETLVEDYKCQIHQAMIVTETDWWDVLSYNPAIDPVLVRVERDAFTETLHKALLDFCDRFAEVARELATKLPA